MPQPATPTTPLDVPATPSGATPNAATGKGNQVLATGATSPGKRKGQRIVITLSKYVAEAKALYQQTQGLDPTEVRTVRSPEDLRALFAEYSEIDHVSMLIHMYADELLFETRQVNLAQAQTILDGSVPRITRWTFDGCCIGRASATLYAFTEHFGIGLVEAWTHFHHVQLYSFLAWGSPSADKLATVHPQVERAVNFFAKGDAGATYTSNEIEAQLQHGTSVTLVSEVLTYDYEDTLRFEDVLSDARWVNSMTGQPDPQPWTSVRDPREAWYPRVAARKWPIDSQAAATAFEQYFDSNPLPCRLQIAPPVTGQ